MGYDIPLHGLNGEKAKIDAITSQPQDPAFNPVQANRALAVTFAASVLSDSNRPGVLGVKIVKAEDIINLASYVVGDVDEDTPQRWMTTGERFEAAEAPLAEKVRERQVTYTPAIRRLFEQVLQRIADKPSVDVPASELRKGDQVAPDGDVLVTQPVYDAPLDVWSARAHCPSTPEGATFEFKAPEGTTVAVFNRGEPDEKTSSVPVQKLLVGDLVTPHGDSIATAPVETEAGWSVDVQCPNREDGDTFPLELSADVQVPVFGRAEPDEA